MPRNRITLTPWDEWKGGKNPEWWATYNNVKHERNTFFKEANLGNAVNALGGLLVLVGYLYDEALADSSFAVLPTIRFDKKYRCGVAIGEEYKVGYQLPGGFRKSPLRP